VAKDYSKTKQT